MLTKKSLQIPLIIFALAIFGLSNAGNVIAGGPDDQPGGESGCVIPESGPWPPCATGGNSGGTQTGGGDCVIPESGPWPPCATGGSGNTGNTGGSDCVIPPSGPWPPCATGGGSGNAGGGQTGDNSGGGECVIPPSGPWPPCATGGGGGGQTGGNAGGGDDQSSGATTEGGGGVGSLPPAPVSGSGPTIVAVNDQVLIPGAKRLGVNIGKRDQFGAAQYIKNVIPNPGFEASEFGMIFIAWQGANGGRVQADNWETRWNNEGLRIGQTAGFWNGARFEILQGAGQGRAGTITNFTHEGGRYTFYLSGGGAVAPGDVIMVQKEMPGFQTDLNAFNKAEANDKRPGSPGRQALRLMPAANGQAAYSLAMDSYGRDADVSAGKLMHVQGNWHFEIWAKGTAPGQQLQVRFRRVGENTFFEETIPLNQGWQQISRDFFVDPSKDPIRLGQKGQALFLELFPVGGQVLVDDAILRRNDYNNPTVFTDPFVNGLREMRPGIIRNWGDQLGSTLDNQLATPFARQSNGYAPKSRVAPGFHYSIPEFLRLAQHIGAEPWYVIPPTWSNAELQNFMAYLAAPAGSHPYANLRAAQGQGAPWTQVFGQIHLEYGNEIWGSNDGNDPFAGASMRGGINGGQIANRRIGVMKGSPWHNAGKFNFVIGGQARFPGRQRELDSNSSAHNQIGLAPYFGELQVTGSDGQRYYPLFAHAWNTVRQSQMVESQNILRQTNKGTGMAIYEINLHAITGNVPLGLRNDFLSGMGGAVALPLTMLTYQRDMGIRNQTAFQAVQYSTRLQNGQYGRVWGLFRDVEATGILRPTGEGLAIANRAVRGNMISTSQSGGNPTLVQAPFNGITRQETFPLVQTFAFKQGNQYSMVLFNLDLNQANQVQLSLPRAPQGNATLHELTAANIHVNNEFGQNIHVTTRGINSFSQNYSMSLLPHSVYVIEWTMN